MAIFILRLDNVFKTGTVDSCFVSLKPLLVLPAGYKMNLFITANLIFILILYFQNKAEGTIWRPWVTCSCTSFEAAFPGKA